MYRSDEEAIKSVYSREVKGLIDGVDETMAVNNVELTMIHACKHCRTDDDKMPANIVKLTMIQCL